MIHTARRYTIGGCIALMMLASVAWAQESGDAGVQTTPSTAPSSANNAPEDAFEDEDHVTKKIAEHHLAQGIDLDVSAPKDRPAAARKIAFENGLEILADRSLDVEDARQALVAASIQQQEARASFAPTVNVAANVTINDPEVTISSRNPLAPLKPWLDDLYQNNPGQQNVLGPARDAAGATPPDQVVTHRVEYGATLTATQPLFNGSFFPAKKLSKLAEQQAHATIAQTTFNVQEAYTQLYFQSVNLQRLSDISKTNVENARISLERAQKRHEAGAGSEIDLTRAEVSYLNALSDYENANIAYKISIEALATLLRVDPDFDVIEPPELPVPQSRQQVIDNAFEQRPALHAAQLQKEQADLQKKQARSTFEPYIFAQGQAHAGRVTAFSGRAVTWNVSLNLSWDLWDGGQAHRGRKRADIARRHADIQKQRMEDTIRKQIRSAWLNMQTQQNIVKRATATAKLAQINYDVAVKSRSAGAASALEVDDAQNALFRAQIAKVNAEMALRSSIYELYRLQGNGQDLTYAAQR